MNNEEINEFFAEFEGKNANPQKFGQVKKSRHVRFVSSSSSSSDNTASAAATTEKLLLPSEQGEQKNQHQRKENWDLSGDVASAELSDWDYSVAAPADKNVVVLNNGETAVTSETDKRTNDNIRGKKKLGLAVPAAETIPAFAEILNSLDGVGQDASFEEKITALISEIRSRRRSASKNEGLPSSENCALSDAKRSCIGTQCFWSSNKIVEVVFHTESSVSHEMEQFVDSFLQDVTWRMAAESQSLETGVLTSCNSGEPQLFCLDTVRKEETQESPGINYEKVISANENSAMDYSSPQDDSPLPKPSARRPRYRKTCFNCESESHGVGDCPEPKDQRKINANKARQRMESSKESGPSTRYHEEERKSAFKPGVISKTLSDALGLRPRDLPPWIYRMRAMGYPPGYLQTALTTKSSLSFWDGTEEIVENVETSNEKKFNPDKVIEYPGFNCPVPEGCNDMSHHNRNFLPMQPHQEKKNFIGLLQRHVDQHNSILVGAEKRKRSQEPDAGTGQPLQKKQKQTPQPVDMELSDNEEEDGPQSPVENDPDASLLPPPPPIPTELSAEVNSSDSESIDKLMEKRADIINQLAEEGQEQSGSSDAPDCEKQQKKTFQRSWSAVSIGVEQGTPMSEGNFSGLTKIPSLESFSKGVVAFEAQEEQLPAQGKGWKVFKVMLEDLQKRKKQNNGD